MSIEVTQLLIEFCVYTVLLGTAWVLLDVGGMWSNTKRGRKRRDRK